MCGLHNRARFDVFFSRILPQQQLKHSSLGEAKMLRERLEQCAGVQAEVKTRWVAPWWYSHTHSIAHDAFF